MTLTTLAPQHFHGFNARAPFFEGWYFKLVDAQRNQRLAVIPGIFLDPAGRDSHAFVQTLNGCTGQTHYHRYPLHDFVADDRRFRLRVGPNFFSTDEVALNLHAPEASLVGVLRFHGVQGWPVSLREPGVMGWYAWVPYMECYHGVLSFDHAITGQLLVDGAPVDLHGGRGYIEKDWGEAFPQAWIWMQTNHFGAPGTSLMASVARIPWRGSAFRGYILGLWHGGRLYRFATYTGATLDTLRIGARQVELALTGPVGVDGKRRRLRLEITARRSDERSDLLHAPARSAMLQRVLESLTSSIDVRLSTEGGATLFAGTGDCAGLELGGDLGLLA